MTNHFFFWVTYLVIDGADLGLRMYLISKLRKLSKCSMSLLLEAVILENNFSWLPHASCKQVRVASVIDFRSTIAK